MTSGVTATGIKGRTGKRKTYETLFRKQIKRVKPPAVGMAVAYVSVYGFNLVKKILREGGVEEVRLVTDTRDRVTHPKALQSAVDSGWNVRVVDDLTGTFHPKLYVGGAGFGGSAGVANLSLAIMGSPNISRNGFRRNGECVFWSIAPHAVNSAGRAWRDCWRAGVPATAERLSEYERAFALRNRFRKPQDLVALGVVDDLPAQVDGAPRKGVAPPKKELKAISEAAASVAWAGLQSFTGEYNLQVEFPKEAGLVLQRIFADLAQGAVVPILCADGERCTFKFRFYEHNGMFRLNVPNETPLVKWARKHKDGIALVEYNEANGGLYFEILPPGERMEDVVGRSLALGTWGRTPTRLYGWY